LAFAGHGSGEHLSVKELHLEEELVRKLSWVTAIELCDDLTHNLDHGVGLSGGENFS
jgi:hypothetical protein